MNSVMNMNAQLYSLAVPLESAFHHTRASHEVARNLILRIDHEGLVALGECVPREYVTNETIESVVRTITSINIAEVIASICWDSSRDAVHGLLHMNWQNYFDVDSNMNAMCLLDLSLFDLVGQYFGRPVSALIGAYALPNEPRDSTLRTVQTMDYSLSVDDFLKRGPFHHVKIKVGRSLEEDLVKIIEIQQRVDGDVSYSIDANMAWTLDQALVSLDKLSQCRLNWCEEPLGQKDFHGYKRLREAVSLPVMLDESVYSRADLDSAVKEGSCDSINVRLSKCGGIAQSIQLIKQARRSNISYQLGAQVAETGPLVAAARHLAECLSDKLAYEAGQVDRFFSKPLFSPTPGVDRKTNCADRIRGNGLGIQIAEELFEYVDRVYEWKYGRWSHDGH